MAEKEYIDREALLDDLDAAMKNSGMGYVVGQTMKRYIKRVPAADVTPVVHGEWIPHDHMSRSPYARNYGCSVCGNSPIENGDFCNKCGARMDGGKHETD